MQLQHLALQGIGLRGLPPSVAQMAGLQTLDLHGNSSYTGLPHGPYQQSLRSLSLAGTYQIFG